MIPLVDLTAQYQSIKEDIDKAVLGTIESGNFILGSVVSNFEKSIAEYLHVSYAIGLASGTDALVLALRAFDIGEGDEVIVPAYTFFATAGSVLAVGAKPIFVDIDPLTYEIDVTQIESRITSQTKAIIPVHLYGHPAQMDVILSIGKKYNLKIIEDNAQAFGSTYNDKKTGTIGDVGCLSFFPTKNLGAYGDGGMLVTNNQEVADRVRMLRTHGWKKKYYSEEVGYNSRLDAIQASVLQVKLPHVDTWNEQRRKIAENYSSKLSLLGYTVPVEKTWGKHVYHLYIIRCDQREQLQLHLKEAGIASDVYYPLPPHLSIPCQKLGYRKGDFPNAEKASTETLALPLYPEMTKDQQNQVVDALAAFGTPK